MSSATSPSLLVKTQFEIHKLEKNQLGNVPYFLSALSKKSSEGGGKIEQDRAQERGTEGERARGVVGEHIREQEVETVTINDNGSFIINSSFI